MRAAMLEGARGGALMKVVCLQVLVCFDSCEKGKTIGLG